MAEKRRLDPEDIPEQCRPTQPLPEEDGWEESSMEWTGPGLSQEDCEYPPSTPPEEKTEENLEGEGSGQGHQGPGSHQESSQGSTAGLSSGLGSSVEGAVPLSPSTIIDYDGQMWVVTGPGEPQGISGKGSHDLMSHDLMSHDLYVLQRSWSRP